MSIANRPPETNMTTATILLNLGLAVGTSAVVATAMAVIANLDRIHLHRRLRGARQVRLPPRLRVDPQPGD
jgi:hypothetical protein